MTTNKRRFTFVNPDRMSKHKRLSWRLSWRLSAPSRSFLAFVTIRYRRSAWSSTGFLFWLGMYTQFADNSTQIWRDFILLLTYQFFAAFFFVFIDIFFDILSLVSYKFNVFVIWLEICDFLTVPWDCWSFVIVLIWSRVMLWQVFKFPATKRTFFKGFA